MKGEIFVIDLRGILEADRNYERIASILEKLFLKGLAAKIREDIYNAKVVSHFACMLQAGYTRQEAIRETRKFAWLLKNKDKARILGREMTIYFDVPESIFIPLDPAEEKNACKKEK